MVAEHAISSFRKDARVACTLYSVGLNTTSLISSMTRCQSRPSAHMEYPQLDKYLDIAAYIKKEFDKKYNPTWHCIVGRNFGSYVTHETRHFIYFYLGQVAILLFKSG
uniref:Dynein light chain n=1 Tax=Anopheles culicifacies TaxID=139723 RepID=A0A182LY73_9DIPT